MNTIATTLCKSFFTLSLGLSASVLCACGSDINIQESPNTAGSSGQPGSSGSPANPGTVDPGQPTDPVIPEPAPVDVSGHYMQMAIGNCINSEDWLSFSNQPDFTHTLVDRNYCGPHGVFAHPGSFAFLPGQVIEMKWKSATDKEGEVRQYTVHPFEPYPYIPPQPMPDGYQAGNRALNTMAYVRTGDDFTYRRTDSRNWTSNPGDYLQTILIEVSFGAPFEPVSEPTPCSMKVRMVGSVSGSQTMPQQGEEFFSFGCMYGPVPDSPWIRVLADGFEENVWGGQWMDLLSKMGIWDKYSAPLSSMFYEKFYPSFYIAPDNSNVLIDNRSTAWYQQMLDGPPVSVE